MQYPVRIESTAVGQPLAVVRRRATLQQLPKVVPEACGIVWGVVSAQKIEGAARHVSVYLDDQINLEVGVELQTPFAGHGEVVSSAIPTGTVATTVHFGPYNRLFLAHQAIRAWCQSQGHVLSGPNWEIYGHWVDAWNSDPARIRTDVYYLLATSAQAGGKSD